MPDRLVPRLAQLPRQLSALPDAAGRLDLAVDLLHELVPACDAVAVLVPGPGGFVTRPGAEDRDEVGGRAGRLEQEVGEGPATEAARGTVVASADLGAEERWPRWTPRAAGQLGLRSVLAVALTSASRQHGALGLYARRVDAFDDTDRVLAGSVAEHLTQAIEVGRDPYGAVPADSSVVGQAEGILMERLGLAPGTAPAYLTGVARAAGTSVVGAARELVDTGHVPGPADEAPR